MKIIHTADLHIDSALKTHLSGADLKLRKAELLANFNRLAENANTSGVEAIIIAGDLFDTNKVSKNASKTILNTIKTFESIDFYYLEGNHDDGFFVSEIDEIPDNLHLFNADGWTNYCLNEQGKGNIMLYGVELNDDNENSFDELNLNARNINLVTLHGSISDSDKKGQAININKLKNKSIDYLALGHIHKPSDFMRLDERGVYCYPGCLEGRGYDECGDHGYVLLDINEETGEIVKEFVPFAYRLIHEIFVDVTGYDNQADMVNAVRDKLLELGIPNKDYVRIVLKGRVPVDTDISEEYIWQLIKDDYYCGMVLDSTRPLIDPESFMNDISLKGEFVRKVFENTSLSLEEKEEVLKMGLRALAGEKFTDED